MVNLLVPAISGGSVVCSQGWTDGAGFFELAARYSATWYVAISLLLVAFAG
jgi:hypothetical protein